MSPLPRLALFALAGLLLVLCNAATVQPAHVSKLGARNATDIECPTDCACYAVPADSDTAAAGYNYAECTSLNGVAEHPRTGAIQAVGLSGIRLERLGNALNKLTNLSIVDLSHNRLDAMPALPRARRVRVLYLDFNEITSGKLRDIPGSVEHLDISHNRLTFLPVAKLQRLHKLTTIALAGNPIECTCETLKVRSWLAARHVTVDEVHCATPAAVSGMPWHLLSEHDVCAAEGHLDIWNDGDNEMMLADQAVVDDVDANEDEFERDFIPIGRMRTRRQSDVSESVAVAEAIAEELESEEDGSGYDEDETSVLSVATEDGSGEADNVTARALVIDTTEAEDESGDGSGGSAELIAPAERTEEPSTTEVNEITTPVEESDEDVTDNATDNITPPDNPLKIFKFNADDDDDDDKETESPSTEAVLLVEADEKTAVRVASAASDAHPHKVTAEEKETAESTYIVLVMLAILLLGLIAFVAIRRKNARRGSHPTHYDLENGRSKELVDMQRSHPGKPVDAKNGAGEVLPLIGARDKWDSRIQPANGLSKPDQEELLRAQEPLLRKLEEPHEEAVDAAVAAVVADELPERRSPQPMPRTHSKRPSSRASDGGSTNSAAGQDVPPETNNNIERPQPADQSGDEPFEPVSPKPARYSPVYSPETGRVKIKLSETPRPRTPMLISRTRSNAGEMVVTPVRPEK